jgi:hypothetical protein
MAQNKHQILSEISEEDENMLSGARSSVVQSINAEGKNSQVQSQMERQHPARTEGNTAGSGEQ